MTPAHSGSRLILLRHAPAAPRDPRRWPDDRDRPLSEEGSQEFFEAARGLSRLLAEEGEILTSPLRRARQTAALLHRAWKGSSSPRLFPPLNETEESASLLSALGRRPWQGDRVLVGHEPQLVGLVGLALTGEAIPLVDLSRGGAIALRFSGPPGPQRGTLLWGLNRKQLRSLGPGE